ncbi:transcriptional corepressor LEUNIG_HOMOLOG-like [Lycium ferocissimum]|uniref:transcriptional corepressor LEUNIG_HOMOLOG-like n=1 Tax=Lycium ferocissimum TaxID=112874 RepID=UPI0028168336|nr:transcriptional corepressor LEUNIG_HOMOLOG-like [Lycium ferocissimum]
MASLEAQRLLEVAILDYLSKRGFNQIGETFSREIHGNQNHVAVNSPHEDFLQVWWGKFYEIFSSRFLGVPLFAAESFDKVLPVDLFYGLLIFN